MFSRLSTAFFYVLVAFTVFAAATTTITVTPPATTQTTPASQCNTGPIQCCLTTGVASTITTALNPVLAFLTIDLSSFNILVGLTCLPLIGSVNCNGEPVCCTNNQFAGALVIGCSPVNLSLRR